MELPPPPSLFLAIQLSLLLLITASSAPHSSNLTDLESLLAFKAQVIDPYGILATNWTTSASFCSWTGVSCSHRRQRVTGIRLKSFNLQGTISPHISNLSFLSYFNLFNNTFTGTIPESLTRLPRLAFLSLERNSLSGPITPAILNMSSLTIFAATSNNLSGSLHSNNNNISLNMFPPLKGVYLGSNQLSGDDVLLSFARCRGLQILDLNSNLFNGTIPTEIGNLPELNILFLADNRLTGTIPASLGNLTKLVRLDLKFNNLAGVIPEELGNLQNLGYLSFGSNRLIGSIPKSLVNKSMLYNLDLSVNMISGKLPVEIGKSLPQLEWLDLGSNHLTGGLEFLSSLSHCKHLRFLTVQDNQLEGVLPDSIGNLSMFLTNFDASHNRIHGNIPNGFGNLTALVQLLLSDNELTGTIPSTVLARLEGLQQIDLSVNKITGSIPIEFGLMTNLNTIVLEDNSLSGSIPGSLSNISRIQKLYLGDNKLSSSIPESLWTLESLLELYLSMNAINGSLSSHLGGLKALVILDLSMNQLSGNISGALGQLQRLTNLDLSMNQLSGNISDALGQLKRLTNLDLSMNQLSGNISGALGQLQMLEYLDLSMNQLSGNISDALGQLQRLTNLDLSMNQLSGNISGALGQLQMLEYLDLSKNLFQGEIPESFGGLIRVTYLNLSRNFLSGVIPKSIANLTYLERLDLSFNKLEGQVPKGRIFSNLSISSLMGNEALCGAPELHLPPCPTIVIKGNSRPIKYILLATGVVLFTCICLMCTFYWMMKKKKKKTLANMDELCLAEYRVVSHHELVRATENFTDANLLGRGAFGSVFRACLDDGLIAAVKVLNLEVEGALKSFEAECQALRMIRHKNLIKIISVCSNLDFKALVLQFMPNGSLEDWLYSDNYCLNLLQRVNIMVDVSLALEYLHHHHPDVVLHCDLKPRNVLLDEEMVAHVSDFGISKLVYADSRSIISTSTPGTIGYIAPEYAFTGAVSKMGDVYSFGILLLETFTGRRPSDAMFGEDSNLREWVCKAHPVSVLDVVDHNLLKDHSNNEGPPQDLTAMDQCLSLIIELGLLCSRYSPKERIPMTDVVVRLQKIKTEYLSSSSNL